MKKMKYLIVAVGLMFALAACSGEQETASGKKTDSKDAVNVHKGLFNVEITIPASMFEGQDINKVIDEAKKEGIKKVTKNSDGSLTYKMTKSQHEKLLKSLNTDIESSLVEMKTSKDYTSIHDVTHNQNYTELTLLVDKQKYENSMDGFSLVALGMSGMMYQLYDGKNNKDIQVKIHVKDKNTNDVFKTVVYPNDFDKTE